MANQLVTPTQVLREVSHEYVNTMVYAANLDRTYDDQYSRNGGQVGDTVQARLRQRFQVKEGAAYQRQDLLDRTVPISLTNQKHVDFDCSSVEMTVDIEDFRMRYVEPAGMALAAAADVQAFEDTYWEIPNAVGTPGTTPTTNKVYRQAVRKIVDAAGPTTRLVAVLDPEQQLELAEANQTLFQPMGDIAKLWKEGQFADAALGVRKWYQSQNVAIHTTGACTSAASPRVNGASQTGSTLAIDGFTSGTASLKKGDTFTIAGVYSVNPVNYKSTGRLQQFTITADSSDSSGAIAALPISPSIITSGQLQTVSASPADDAVITYLSMTDGGTQPATVSPQGVIFHPGFGAFVMADLKAPDGGAEVARVRAKGTWNISMRWVKDFDIREDENLSRIDILIGSAVIDGTQASRIYG